MKLLTIANAIDRQFGGQFLDHVHLRAAGRREVDMPPWARLQPRSDLLVFVRALVVHDEVQIQLVRCSVVDLFRESKPLDVCALFFRARNDLPVQVFQCGKEGDGPMTNVVTVYREEGGCSSKLFP